MAKTLYEILTTGAVNSDEHRRLTESGWRWATCQVCKRGPTYTSGGECMQCRHDGVGTTDADWATDAALARPRPFKLTLPAASD